MRFVVLGFLVILISYQVLYLQTMLRYSQAESISQVLHHLFWIFISLGCMVLFNKKFSKEDNTGAVSQEISSSRRKWLFRIFLGSVFFIIVPFLLAGFFFLLGVIFGFGGNGEGVALWGEFFAILAGIATPLGGLVALLSAIGYLLEKKRGAIR